MPGRNDPCPCGSGEKYKKCCGEVSATAVSQDAEAHNSLGLALHEAGRPAEAAVNFRTALKLRPNFAEAHGNLGNALIDLGQLEDAVHHYRRMLELRPDLAEAHNNLGNALLALRRFEEAVTSYRRALGIKPNAAGAHANLGNALRELGRPQEALTHCRRALELEPDAADAEILMGNVQFDLGQLDEAARCYTQAIELQPDSAEAHIALSKVARQTGRVAEAEQSCSQALKIAADSADALTLLGEIQADRGRFGDAEQLFRRAISIAPDMPEAWAGLARYRKMGVDATWLAAAQRLLGKSLGIGQEINLRYALGKYFDDVQDYDNAFASYRLANELKKRSGIQHDRQRHKLRVDQIMTLYDRDWLRVARAEGHPSRRPVFIVGMPRSGTTLTEQILASHPAAFGGGELRFWHSASVNYESLALRGAISSGAVSAAADKYLEFLAALSADASRVIDKMPANFLNLGLIHAAFPHARIIHMQRNPLDTGLSIYFQIFSNTHTYANDLEDIAHYFTQYSRLMQHWRSTLTEGAMLDVPYEKLVEDPEPWIRKIVQFAGLPWDPCCLDFHRTERTVVTASNWQVRQRITKSSSGRWRNYEQFLGPLRRLAQLEPCA
jgi:tetratricopeptide (TPR) repeat protein